MPNSLGDIRCLDIILRMRGNQWSFNLCLKRLLRLLRGNGLLHCPCPCSSVYNMPFKKNVFKIFSVSFLFIIGIEDFHYCVFGVVFLLVSLLLGVC